MGRLHAQMRVGTAAVILMLVLMTSAYNIVGKFPADSLVSSREKRSGAQPALQTCNTEVVDNLAKSVQETCANIGDVDTYVANVNSRQPLLVPSFNDLHGFKDILTQYNTDLKTAQDNCQPWRNGDSILESMTGMIVAAQEFEPKFNKEYNQSQARVKNILENHEDIGKTEAKIAELEATVADAREAAELVDDPNVLAYFEGVIKSKEEEINSTIKDHEVVQGRHELDELIKYLEFVRNNAALIKVKADDARTKISNFKNNITTDATAFKRHRTNAQEGIRKLDQEKQNNNEELVTIRQNQDDLNKKITTERSDITSLNEKIQKTQIELQKIENEIAKTKRKTRWFICLTKTADLKRDFINEQNRFVENLRSQIARSIQDIAQFQSRISSLETKSRQLEQELQHFSTLDGNLQSLESEVDSILPKIENAITGVNKMSDSFDAIKQNLDDTIVKAKESKTAAEVSNIKYFIYNEIGDLKCKWESANKKILAVEQCT